MKQHARKSQQMQNNMKNNMKGLSLVGFILVMIIVVIFAIFGMKIGPMYLEFNGVKSAMNALAAEQFESPKDVKDALLKRLSINYVETVKREDIVVKPQNGGYNISVDYYVDKPLVGNLSVSGHFQHSVTTGN